ncbi:hypothetical protein AAF712_016786, partial [Marasmius tenuissimus]
SKALIADEDIDGYNLDTAQLQALVVKLPNNKAALQQKIDHRRSFISVIDYPAQFWLDVIVRDQSLTPRESHQMFAMRVKAFRPLMTTMFMARQFSVSSGRECLGHNSGLLGSKKRSKTTASEGGSLKPSYERLNVLK